MNESKKEITSNGNKLKREKDRNYLNKKGKQGK
jgi:hypothetical protein